MKLISNVSLNWIWILGVFNRVEANHVLVNEYQPGQGIMPHTDGPLFYPVICTISCGSHTVLRFHENNDVESNEQRKIVCQLLLEPRSLLILKDDMYENYLHSIADETNDDIIDDNLTNLEQCTEFKNHVGETIARNRRISLTIRHVPKTSKIHLRLGHWCSNGFKRQRERGREREKNKNNKQFE